jgi:hypothetical protein
MPIIALRHAKNVNDNPLLSDKTTIFITYCAGCLTLDDVLYLRTVDQECATKQTCGENVGGIGTYVSSIDMYVSSLTSCNGGSAMRFRSLQFE